MITYANVPLTPLTDQLREKCERWWDEHAPDLFSYPGYLTAGIDHLPIPYPPSRRPARPGVLSWPIGASRWATFHHFVTGDQLAAIRLAVGDAEPTARTLLIADDDGDSIQTLMWLLPPRPIFQSGTWEVYLITLVDDRYRWWLKGDQISAGASIWSALLTALFASVTASPPTIPTIPAAYKTPLSRWDVGAKSMPLLIDAACAAVGLRCVRGLDGTITLPSGSAAVTAQAEQFAEVASELAYGGLIAAEDVGRSVPATVAVAFPTVGGSPTVTTVTLATLAIAEYGDAVGMPSATAQVNADLLSRASSGDRTAYATQAATDYYLWSLSLVDATFRMVIPWVPTGIEDRIEWENRPDCVLTRVVRNDVADRDILGDLPPSVSATPVPRFNGNWFFPANIGANCYYMSQGGQLVIGDCPPGSYVAFACGMIDRSGLGAAEVRIGIVLSDGDPAISPIPQPATWAIWQVLSCPAGEKTGFCLAGGFLSDLAADPGVTLSPFVGLAIENMSGGSPSGGSPPTPTVSNFILSEPGVVNVDGFPIP